MYHLGILYKTKLVNFGASQTSRENNDSAHRTFQDAKRIWEDHSYTNEVWHVPKRNSDY